MNEKENEEAIKKKEQLESVADALGSYFEKEQMEVGLVMSVLFTMLVNTMLDHANIPPHEAIRLFSQAICDFVDRQQEEVNEVKPNEEKLQWLN
jgi:hypothetical protein